jgi:hypothetical protein
MEAPKAGDEIFIVYKLSSSFFAGTNSCKMGQAVYE